ncbi:MAG TPA: DnaJ domain-containing protein [Thermodesulfovibrionales bacterium]|nr:DnaJ domain-containing protein [Thermodesulfovibrionales bacterium]
MYIMRVLDLLERLEAKISELYEWFSRIYAQDAEAASLFYRISIDETAHANLVKYEKRLVAQNTKIFGEISLDPGVINATLEMVTSVLSAASPSLEQAVKVSLDIEHSAAEAHYRAAIAQASPDISRLLENLEGFDTRHIEVFEEFAANRGYPFVSKSKPSPDRQVNPDRPVIKPDKTRIPIPPKLLEKIQYYYDLQKSMNFYKLLGIYDFASNEEIKKAFHSFAREFHPDIYMNASEEVQQQLHTIFAHATDAYSTLMDPVKRRNYDMTRPRPRK